MQKEMLQSFLNMKIAEDAFIRWQGLISAAKDVSCTQPILEQQPEENFVSFLY
jgi:hypothetical protein